MVDSITKSAPSEPTAKPRHTVPGGIANLWRSYRFLFTVCVLVAILAGVETRKGADPQWRHEDHYAETLFKLYPDRPHAQQAKALQAGRCFQTFQETRQISELCEQYRGTDVNGFIREKFQKSLAAGVKDSEDLHYNYLMFLISTDAPRREIRAAHRAWKETFPLSRQGDPLAPPPPGT